MPTSPEPDLTRLTDRERQVLRLLARGHDTRSAARTLGISSNALAVRLREAGRKLGAANADEAVRLLVEADPEEFATSAQSRRLDRQSEDSRRAGVYFLFGLMLVAVLVGALELWLTSRG